MLLTKLVQPPSLSARYASRILGSSRSFLDLMRIFSHLCCVSKTQLDYDDVSKESVAGPSKAATSKKSAKPELYSEERAKKLFKVYEDPDSPGEIGPEGFEKLCEDLEISMEGALPLVLAWQMHATEMAKFKESEWMQGTSELR